MATRVERAVGAAIGEEPATRMQEVLQAAFEAAAAIAVNNCGTEDAASFVATAHQRSQMCRRVPQGGNR